MALVNLNIKAGKKYLRFNELVKNGIATQAIINMIRATTKPIITSLKFKTARLKREDKKSPV